MNLRAPVLVNLDQRIGAQIMTTDDQPLQYPFANLSANLRQKRLRRFNPLSKTSSINRFAVTLLSSNYFQAYSRHVADTLGCLDSVCRSALSCRVIPLSFYHDNLGPPQEVLIQLDDAQLRGALTGREKMLVLSRHRDESIMIGDDVVVTIVDIRGDKVRLGIDAPRGAHTCPQAGSL